MPMTPPLSNDDLNIAAKAISCDVAAIKAVCEVEAPKGGFLPDGRPVVLFEGHVFFRLVGGKFAKEFPGICHKFWDRSQYAKSGFGEWHRLSTAMGLDRTAAIKSASWGKFQILGENYKFCGFDSPQQFVNAMYRSELDHLLAFVAFVKHMRLDDELRNKDWAGFAKGYNGPGYSKNRYDVKLADAFDKHTAA